MTNLIPLLKDLSKDYKLWCDTIGECIFNIRDNGLIEVSTHDEKFILQLSSYGQYWEYDTPATSSNSFPCILWPSKDHRTWDDFEPNKWRIEDFKPFDKVLARDYGEDWKVDFFSHYDSTDNISYPFRCVGSHFVECIPYNEETAHLIGTNQEPPKKYIIW